MAIRKAKYPANNSGLTCYLAENRIITRKNPDGY